MRVALIALHFAEYASSLALALTRSHRVLLVVSEPNFSNEVEDDTCLREQPGLTLLKIPHRRNPLVAVANVQRLRVAVARFRPDIIHCQEDPKDCLAGVLPFWSQWPLVLTIHDPVTHSGVDAKASLRLRIYRNLLRRRADAAIVHGQPMLELARKTLPWLSTRIFSAHHGPLGMLAQPRFQLDWEAGSCLFFGRIEEYKGLPFFLEAIRRLRSEGLHVQGVIAGRGSDLDRSRDSICGDPALTLREGYLSPGEVLATFQRAQVVVLPYLDATQSGVAAYALGMGRPTVAFQVGSMEELVRHGMNGLLVPPRDIDALVAAIRRLVSSPALSRQMAVNARDLSLGQLSWPEAARLTEQAYCSAIASFNHNNSGALNETSNESHQGAHFLSRRSGRHDPRRY